MIYRGIECCEKNQNDETLSIINKPKHFKKGWYKEQNGRTQVQEDKRTISKGEPQRGHQVLEPLLVAKNISNKERGGPPKKTPGLEEPSPIVIAHCKVETVYARCNIIDTLCL